MLTILVFADWYEPGYKAGGPIRSCVNFARYMSGHYRVFIFTSDRDLGSSAPYEGVTTDHWSPGNTNKNIGIYYCSPQQLTWSNIRQQMDVIRPDFIYLNSMFSTKFTIYPLLIERFRRPRTQRPASSNGQHTRIILSPRGMLRESAIRFKSVKKRLFLTTLRLLKFHRAIHFHATDETEVRDVYKYFGPSSKVTMVANFPGATGDDRPFPLKQPGQLSMIFIGRIHPIKNLHFLLQVMKEVTTILQLTIIGSLEDELYWKKCRSIIAELPATAQVDYAGEMANHALPDITARHHIFVSPTRGENFGHAIFEALTLGKPVLISDQTPWRGLQAVKAGWDLPLDSPGRFREAIEVAGAFDQAEYEKWSHSTRQYVQNYINRLNLKEEYQKLFS
jgi:glycosyltransferase involved in cell wall biosynthesis